MLVGMRGVGGQQEKAWRRAGLATLKHSDL